MITEVYVLIKGWTGGVQTWPVAVFSSLYDLEQHMKDKKAIHNFNGNIVAAWSDEDFTYTWASVDYYE